VVGKEISLKTSGSLRKCRLLFEHPATVLVFTNLAYADAPGFTSTALGCVEPGLARSPAGGRLGLSVEQQITEPVPFLSQNWKAGEPQDRQPRLRTTWVHVLYRRSYPLDLIIRARRTMANYDLVIASQPYRARASLTLKPNASLHRCTGDRPRRPTDRDPLAWP
jgi:hypothetical protein